MSLLDDVLREAQELTEWIDVHQPTRFQFAGSNDLAVGWFALALEHRAALIALASMGANSSAAALLRCEWEAFMRGSWAAQCATEVDRRRFLDDGVMPKMARVIAELVKVPNGDAYRLSHDMMWEAASDFSHGGIRQMERWLGPTIGASYSEQSVAQLVSLSDAYGLMACRAIAITAGVDLAPFEARFAHLMTVQSTMRNLSG